MKRRDLKWFLRDWAPLGYTAVYARSGHIKVLDPEGRYVTSLSASPRNRKSAELEGGRVLRRYHDDTTTGGTTKEAHGG